MAKKDEKIVLKIISRSRKIIVTRCSAKLLIETNHRVQH
jgi:hypothetical protein